MRPPGTPIPLSEKPRLYKRADGNWECVGLVRRRFLSFCYRSVVVHMAGVSPANAYNHWAWKADLV
jgi:hypothetical protein